MSNPTPEITNTKFIELLKTYWAWRRLWIFTTVLFGGLGLVYVCFLKSDTWVASQGLIVRDEANGAVMRLGRFQSQTEMKAAQETILEMARNTQVLREALLEVGPSKGLFSFNKITESWPSQREVAELADESIGVRAPQGAEFGTTEVIYLDIKQHSRDRALALNKAVCQALDNRLRQVRVARADGVINELVRASSMATDELKKAADQLQIVEREAGADLADLRGLSEANGNGSASRNQLENVKTELRQVETQHTTLQSDLALLRENQADPERILSAPASILSAHPGLRKLREGLADAQLNSSQLRGRFTSTHPLVSVATSAESEIKQQLRNELALAASNAAREVANSQTRLDNLKRQQAQLEERLQRLARIRTEHEQLNQEVRSRTKILQDAERQLADTRAARDAALTTSLLTRIDDPVLGEKPVGPGRTTILAAMTLAGMFFGMGIVFLLTPLDGTTPNSNRWNEQLGRRLSDRFPWLADKSPNGSPRRRRNDIERRQNKRDAAASTNVDRPGRGRRQSDQLIASASSVATAPEIQEEDPSVATRLDNMLKSELAALAPVARPEIQSSQEVAASLEDTKPAIETVLDDQMIQGPAAANPSELDVPNPEVVRAEDQAARVLERLIKTQSTGKSKDAEPTRPRLRTRDSAQSQPVEKNLSVPPQADAPQTDGPLASAPSKVDTPISAPVPMVNAPVVPRPPVASAARPAASELAKEPMANPTKPAISMFRPNQALEVSPPERPTGFVPPAVPPKPAPLASGFDTPVEGGLAGIGLPTQKLPDSFEYRQGLR